MFFNHKTSICQGIPKKGFFVSFNSPEILQPEIFTKIESSSDQIFYITSFKDHPGNVLYAITKRTTKLFSSVSEENFDMTTIPFPPLKKDCISLGELIIFCTGRDCLSVLCSTENGKKLIRIIFVSWVRAHKNAMKI